MGFLDPNTVIGILEGKLGDLVFVRAQNGKVIVRHRPERKSEFTEVELAGQSRFARAAAYVKAMRAQPEVYALYQKAAKLAGKRACDLAQKDFHHAPVISDVDFSCYRGLSGQIIRIHAVDDFELLRLVVTIGNLTGTVLEQGPAVLDTVSALWLYTTTVDLLPGQTVLLQATAVDRPGNVVTKTVHYASTTAA